MLGSDLLDTADEMLRIVRQNDGFGLNEVEQRQRVVRFAAKVVDHADAVEALYGELRLDVEGAYAVDVVTEKVDAIGHLVGERENVEN